MKKITFYFIFLAVMTATVRLSAQCATTSAPGANCSFGDQINAFSLNSIAATGNSGCGSGAYNNFASQVWTLQVGNSYNWSATVGSGLYNQGVGIWIDLNNDGVYGSNEFLVSSAAALSHSGSFVIPYSSSVGVTLRMRVRCRYNTGMTSTDPCTTFSYGETEDYSVFLTCPASLPAPTIANSTTATPVCGGTTLALTASGAVNYAWSGGLVNATTFTTNAVNTTYTVVASIPGCSTATSSAVTTVSVLPTPTISGVSSGSICPGASYVVTPSGASTYSYISTTTLTGASATLQPLSSTSYTVRGTGANGCVSVPALSATLSVTTLASPTLVPASSPAVICNGQTSTLSVSGANTYTWAAASSSATGANFAVSPSVTSVYTVSGTGTNVCNGVSTITVTVNQLPTVTVNSGTICSGYSIALSPSGASTYTITGPTGTLSSPVSPLSTVNYTVSGTNAQGCNSNSLTSAINTVVVIASPTISAVASNTLCLASTFSLLPTGANTYSLNGVSTATAGTVSPAVTTTYVVTGTGTNGCVSPTANAATRVITIVPLPTITAVSNSVGICVGQATAVLTAGGANTYTWSTLATTQSIAVSPSVTTIYTVAGTSTLLCSNFNTVAVTVYTLPTLATTNSSSFICVGGTSTLGVSGASTYVWNNNATTSTISVSPVVTTGYTVSGKDNLGCVNVTTLSVQVNSLTISTSPNSSICIGSQASLSASGAVTYTWNNVFQFQSFNPSPTVSTVYTVNAIDANSCLQTKTVSVSVWSLPNVTATADRTVICVGESATITAGGANTYTWSTSSTAGSIVVSPTVNVLYNYSVTGTDANGCVNSGSAKILVSTCTGITKNSQQLEVNLYPNPNNGKFVVEMGNGSVRTVEVVDITGRTILSQVTSNNELSIDLGNYASGVYYVKVSSEGHNRILKVVKQ